MASQRIATNEHRLTCAGCGRLHKPEDPCRLDLVEEIERLVRECYATAKSTEAAYVS